MNNIRNGLSRKFHVDDESVLERVMQAGKLATIKKGEYLSTWHKPFEDIALLINGLFRGFVLDENGEEHTDCIPQDYLDTITAKPDFKNSMPINFQALEDSTVFIIPMELAIQLAQENPNIMQAINEITVSSLNKHWQVKQVLYQLKGIDKYRWFLENHGDLINRVPLEHIASYLGITPVSLSRFRKQIRDENGES